MKARERDAGDYPDGIAAEEAREYERVIKHTSLHIDLALLPRLRDDDVAHAVE